MYTFPRLVRVVRVVKQWLTCRTVCELHIIRETLDVYKSPRLVRLVRVVKQWFTSRTDCELHIIRENRISMVHVVKAKILKEYLGLITETLKRALGLNQ